MNSRVYLKVMVAGLAGTSVLFSACVPGSRSELNDKELVGKQLFFDESLSEPTGQSCGTCHEPTKGFGRYIRTDHFGRGRERLVQQPELHELFVCGVCPGLVL